MKTLLETIAVACSMFSALPMPQITWNEKNMRFCMAAFPLVGVVTGLLQAAWIIVCGKLGWSSFLLPIGMVVIPILVSGGIHLDGYMDVSDALSSYGDASKKREILEDPHIGAFAVIRLTVLILLTFGFASELSAKQFVPLTETGMTQLILLGCSYVLSRSLSGLAVALFPLSKDTGLAHTFQSAADKKKTTVLLILWVVLTIGIMFAAGVMLSGWRGILTAILMLCCAFGQWVYLRYTAMRKFGGLSGDLNGWFLQKAELWMLAAMVLAQVF